MNEPLNVELAARISLIETYIDLMSNLDRDALDLNAVRAYANCLSGLVDEVRELSLNSVLE